MMLFLASTRGRAAVFILGLPMIWAAYFSWRPPLPMLKLGHVEHLPEDSNNVAITIDDGPHPLTTPLLLASLKRAGVSATFFAVGEGLRHYPELAHRIVAEGNYLGNHSQPHHNLTTVPESEYPKNIDLCFDEIDRVYAAAKRNDQTRLFRPPGGGLDRNLMSYLYRRGYTLAWWSSNPGDWTCPPAWRIADTVKANLRPGDILLLHDAGTGTPQAIPAIVKEAHARGLTFVPMPENAGD